MMRTVTLIDEDVEWVSDVEDEHAEFKAAAFDDEKFVQWVDDHGLEESLEIAHRFHRVIANQLIRSGMVDYRESRWSRRTCNLNKAVKRRRNQLRTAYEARRGREALDRWLDDFATRHPRAVRPEAA